MADNWTPGPWHVDGHDLSAVIHKVSDKGTAGTYECIAKCPNDNWRADARLIAAAPELYDALDALVADGRKYITTSKVAEELTNHALQNARAALSKARGDQPDSAPEPFPEGSAG